MARRDTGTRVPTGEYKNVTAVVIYGTYLENT